MADRYGKLDPATWGANDLIVYADYSPFLFVVSDESEIPEPRRQAVVLSYVWNFQDTWPPFYSLFPFADDDFVLAVDTAFRMLQNYIFQRIEDIGDRYANYTEEVIVKELDRTGENLRYLATFLLGSATAASLLVSAPIMGTIAKIAEFGGGVISGVWNKTEAIRQLIANKITAARAIYARVAEAIHLDKLLVIERILDLTWKEYTDVKTNFLQKVGVLSQQLFGDIHVVNQWLNLAGMLFQDWALLEGYTWEQQEIEWLVKSSEFLSDTEDRIEAYAQNPEQLWIDMELALVRPIYEARAERMTLTEKGREAVSGGVDEIRQDYAYLDRRLREYQLSLPDTVRGTLGPGLLKFRRDLKDVWNDDLKGVLDDISYVARLDQERIESIKTAQAQVTKVVEQSRKMLSDPKHLSPTDAAEQAEVHGRIQTSLADRLRSFTLEVNEIVTPGYGKRLQEVWEGK